SPMPGPGRAAASLTAVRSCALPAAPATTSGPGVGLSRRAMRSVGRRRSHSDRKRRSEVLLVIVPFHLPVAAGTVAVLLQRQKESGAPDAAEPVAAAGRGRYPPA